MPKWGLKKQCSKRNDDNHLASSAEVQSSSKASFETQALQQEK